MDKLFSTTTTIQEATASEIQQITNSRKIPTIRFEDQQLTSLSGLLICIGLQTSEPPA